MKHYKLINKLIIGAMSSIGVCALIGGSIFSTHSVRKVEAAYPDANLKIGAKNFSHTSGTYTSADAVEGETVSGTATFTRGNNVEITFDNFSYSGPGGEASSEYDRGAFYLSCYDGQNTVINLIGNNYITLTGDAPKYAYGMFVNNTNTNATTTFQGGGSLTITFTGYNKSSECIYVKSRAVINENVTINATAGKARTNYDVYGESFGFSACSMTMNSGTLNLVGGTSDSYYSTGTTSAGLYIDESISYFNGGTINAYSVAAADDKVTAASISAGIMTDYAEAIFRGTEIHASSSTAYTGKCAGIYVLAGSSSPKTITFEGGEVEVTGIGGNANNSYGFAFNNDNSTIVVEKEAKLTVIGSTKTFEKAAVINKIKGEGWNNTSGSGDPEYILKSNEKRAVNYKKAYFEIAPGVIEQAPTAITNLSETGEPLVLVNAGSSSTGTMQYKVGSGEWGADLPTATNQGDYTVYYRSIASDGIHEDVIDDSTQKLVVTIGAPKPQATYKVTPAAISGLVANGSAQALVSAGSSDYGSVMYRLNETGEFTESVPTATEAGTYVVEFKIHSTSEDYSDSAVTKVEVTIAAAPAPSPASGGNGSLPGGAIAAIVIASILVLLCGVWVLMMFVLNKWIKVGDKVVRAFKVFGVKKDGKYIVWGFPFKFVTREEAEIFKTKKEASK